MDKIVHASCISVSGKGLLIMGESRSGKSALALQLIALGADLVADDKTYLLSNEDCIRASSPQTIRGSIEARGVGILKSPSVDSTKLCYIVNMDKVERHRLPDERSFTLLGHTYPLYYRIDGIHFASSLWLLLCHGRSNL